MRKIGIVCGKGIVGIGKYKPTINGKHTKVYNCWSSMIKRCYNNKYPTYKEAYVCDEWLNFQTFGEWFDKNYIDGYELDKDLLVKNNKFYSPDTCCFLPQQINKLLTTGKSNRGNLPIGISLNGNNYKVQININAKIKNFGTFKTPDLAFLRYKEVKENYIKDLANSLKDNLTENVYQALINYNIEITD